MKYTLITIIFLFIFSSCSKKKELKTSEETKKDTSLAEIKQVSPPQQADSNQTEIKSIGIKNLVYETSDIPKSVKYSGKIVGGAKWEDKNGFNVLIICETDETEKGDERSKELFAYQYIIEGENAKLLWKVNDFIKDCPFDVTLSYIPKSLSITDIDNNSIAENTFLYKLSCRSDVSPNDMKLIMHEGDKKYAIRGQMLLQMGNEKYGGDMKIDPSFNNAPNGFLDYAKNQWSKFKNEIISN